MLQDAAKISRNNENIVTLYENDGAGAMVSISFEDIDPADGPFLLDVITPTSITLFIIVNHEFKNILNQNKL
jgi:hypothetical protein